MSTTNTPSNITLPRHSAKRCEDAATLAGAETDLDRMRSVAASGMAPHVWRSLQVLPFPTAEQANTLKGASVIVVTDAHAVCVDMASGREYRQIGGQAVLVTRIPADGVPEFGRSALACLKRTSWLGKCKEGETPAQALVRHVTAGLRKQGREVAKAAKAKPEAQEVTQPPEAAEPVLVKASGKGKARKGKAKAQ